MMIQEFDKPVDRSGTMALKWDAKRRQYENDGLLPFWIADGDYACAPEITDALRRRVENGIFGYSAADERYYEAVSGWFRTRHKIPVTPQWIIPTVGVVTAMSYAVRAFSEPGDAVVLQSPVYAPFYKVILRNRRSLRDCPLLQRGGRYEMDFAALESAFAGGAKIMLFCNPHNPLGRVWERREVTRLKELCRSYGVVLLSDEIHCDLALFGNPFTSALTELAPKERTVAFTAPSKTFNIAGLACSNILAPNEKDRLRLRGLLEDDMVMGPNALGLAAAEAAYRCAGDWADRQRGYLEENVRFLQQKIRRETPRIGLFEHQGTYLVWMDCRCFGLETGELLSLLGRRYGVAPGGGAEYGPAGEGFLRWNVSCPRAQLQEGLDRLSRCYRDIVG